MAAVEDAMKAAAEAAERERVAAHVPLDLGEKLVNAARTADLALLKRLLKSKSVDVDYVDAKGVTALLMACNTGQASAVRVLLKAGATVDARGAHGITALHAACTMNHVECAELLIGAGATVDVTDPHTGITPLSTRGAQQPPSLVRLLLDAKASTSLRVEAYSA